MKVFDIELRQDMIDAIATQAELGYPDEVCGVIVGRANDPTLARVEPLKNVQNRYHQRDPINFPRDARDAFRVDELERMRLLDRLEGEGLIERVLYHSHCDAGAYFSPEDRAMAVREGIELLPGVLHLVVSVRSGVRKDAAIFRFDPARGVFDEARVPIERPSNVLPDLAARAMEGREAARPIRPVGRGLVPRRVTAQEAAELASRSRAQVAIDASTAQEVERFGLGLWSPLAGFVSIEEARCIAERGTLLDGTPWRRAIELVVSEAPSRGLVELAYQGQPAAALEITGAQPVARGLQLAGDLFVYPRSDSARGAPDVRAELLRRGARRVLSTTYPWDESRHGPLLEMFDVLIAAGGAPREERILPFPLPTFDLWCDALIAQNLGATHVFIEENARADHVRADLQIEPFLRG